MKRIIQLTLAVIALVAIAHAQDVTYNLDSDANFAGFKTYKWVEIKGGVQLDDLMGRQLTSALEAGLAKKGFAKASGDTADLFIGYQVAIKQEREITSYDSGWGMGPRWGGGMSSATTSTLHIGSVALDMYDSSKQQLVWRGVATKTIDEGAKPDKRQKNIAKGVEKLLKDYPPKKK